jgi:hypothetical protein
LIESAEVKKYGPIIKSDSYNPEAGSSSFITTINLSFNQSPCPKYSGNLNLKFTSVSGPKFKLKFKKSNILDFNITGQMLKSKSKIFPEHISIIELCFLVRGAYQEQKICDLYHAVADAAEGDETNKLYDSVQLTSDKFNEIHNIIKEHADTLEQAINDRDRDKYNIYLDFVTDICTKNDILISKHPINCRDKATYIQFPDSEVLPPDDEFSVSGSTPRLGSVRRPSGSKPDNLRALEGNIRKLADPSSKEAIDAIISGSMSDGLIEKAISNSKQPNKLRTAIIEYHTQFQKKGRDEVRSRAIGLSALSDSEEDTEEDAVAAKRGVGEHIHFGVFGKFTGAGLQEKYAVPLPNSGTTTSTGLESNADNADYDKISNVIAKVMQKDNFKSSVVVQKYIRFVKMECMGIIENIYGTSRMQETDENIGAELYKFNGTILTELFNALDNHLKDIKESTVPTIMSSTTSVELQELINTLPLILCEKNEYNTLYLPLMNSYLGSITSAYSKKSALKFYTNDNGLPILKEETAEGSKEINVHIELINASNDNNFCRLFGTSGSFGTPDKCSKLFSVCLDSNQYNYDKCRAQFKSLSDADIDIEFKAWDEIKAEKKQYLAFRILLGLNLPGKVSPVNNTRSYIINGKPYIEYNSLWQELEINDRNKLKQYITKLFESVNVINMSDPVAINITNKVDFAKKLRELPIVSLKDNYLQEPRRLSLYGLENLDKFPFRPNVHFGMGSFGMFKPLEGGSKQSINILYGGNIKENVKRIINPILEKLNKLNNDKGVIIKPEKINKIHKALIHIHNYAEQLEDAELKINTYDILRSSYPDQKYITNFDYEQILKDKQNIRDRLNKVITNSAKIELALSGIN